MLERIVDVKFLSNWTIATRIVLVKKKNSKFIKRSPPEEEFVQQIILYLCVLGIQEHHWAGPLEGRFSEANREVFPRLLSRGVLRPLGRGRADK